MTVEVLKHSHLLEVSARRRAFCGTPDETRFAALILTVQSNQVRFTSIGSKKKLVPRKHVTFQCTARILVYLYCTVEVILVVIFSKFCIVIYFEL